MAGHFSNIRVAASRGLHVVLRNYEHLGLALRPLLRPPRVPSAVAERCGQPRSCTALHAAWWIDVQGWSAKQVVAELGFSHASAVTRVLQRYFDCSIRILSEVGGFQELLYRFETTLLGGRILPSWL